MDLAATTWASACFMNKFKARLTRPATIGDGTRPLGSKDQHFNGQRNVEGAEKCPQISTHPAHKEQQCIQLQFRSTWDLDWGTTEQFLCQLKGFKVIFIVLFHIYRLLPLEAESSWNGICLPSKRWAGWYLANGYVSGTVVSGVLKTVLSIAPRFKGSMHFWILRR